MSITSTGLAADTVYKIGYSPGTLFHSIVRDRVRVVYEHANIPVEFIPLPHKRSIADANSGILDGEAGRVSSVEKGNKNLVRVNVKLIDVVGAAYARKGYEVRYTPELLEFPNVGYVLGVQWAERLMKGKPAYKVRDYKTLFTMLVEGRISIALATTASANSVLAAPEFQGNSIIRLDPVIFREPIYHYVNVRNAHLVPILEKTIQSLIDSGYWGETE